jgi:glutamate/tyrosine decarboxylase-like PLP-dependent enzyme
VAGAIDPLVELAAIARRERLYLHVDAAWGGAAALSPRGRDFLIGIEQADSVTLDAHKWLGMPLAAGLFLARDPGALRAAFAAESYFGGDHAEADLSVSSLQWSRRANGLKLYLALRVLGLRGMAEMIDHGIALGEMLRAALTRRGWRIESDTPLPVVCFSDPGGAPPGPIAQRLGLRGQAFVTAMTLAGRPVLRAGIVNAKTEAEDVERLMDHLDAARRAATEDRKG